MKNDEMHVSKTSKGNGTIKPRQACLIGPFNSCERRRKALRIRTTAAQLQDRLPSPDHPCNAMVTKAGIRIKSAAIFADRK